MRPGMAVATTGRAGQASAKIAVSGSRECARSQDRAPGEAHTNTGHEREEGGGHWGNPGFP